MSEHKSVIDLTQKAVEKLKPGTYRDKKTPGLVLRVRESGFRSYCVEYRPKGARKAERLAHKSGKRRLRVEIECDDVVEGFPDKIRALLTGDKVKVTVTPLKVSKEAPTRRATIGAPSDTITLAYARRRARDILGAARDEGRDLLAEERAQEQQKRAEQQVSDEHLFETVYDAWLTHWLKDKATAYVDGIKAIFKKHVLPEWKDRDIRTIRRPDVAALLDKVVANTPGEPSVVNSTQTYLSGMFTFAVNERGLIDVHPASRMTKRSKQKSRERRLTDKEVKALWPLYEQAGVHGALLRIWLLTATRRNEARLMRWSELDLDAGVWELAGDHAKFGKGRTIYLSSEAVRILRELPRHDACDFVFTVNGKAAITGWHHVKRPLDKKAAVTGYTVHDLRRTAASIMGDLGIPKDPVIKMALGHAVPGVTSIYDRSKREHELRSAFAKVADYVLELAHPTPGKVVPIRAPAEAEMVVQAP
jgi:integrase